LISETPPAIAADLRALDIDGVIATNASIGGDGLRRTAVAAQTGGFSAAPLHPLSVRVVAMRMLSG